LAMGLLSALGIVVAVMVRWRLRLAVLCRYIGRVAREPELTARRRGRDRLLNNRLIRLAMQQYRKLLIRSDLTPMPSTRSSPRRHRARRSGRSSVGDAGVIAAHRTDGEVIGATDVRSIQSQGR